MVRFRTDTTKTWIGWCEDCATAYDSGNPMANYDDAVRHVVLLAHNVIWRGEDTGRLTPADVAANR